MSRMFYNKIGNTIDRVIDNDHDDKAGQLAWAWSGSQKIACGLGPWQADSALDCIVSKLRQRVLV